ncbi:hypothetical protein PF006_g312 [Phytophthora fragariae]|uniref:Uncharacterized protein n=1 Tax=Phytophthora fragariae TaxID=53985 RepID=A0A6A3UX01_9STRA|nr:hypothetical protein PF006_g312 [Phytophthora fragariae]
MAGRDRRSDADGTLILQLRPTHEQEGLALAETKARCVGGGGARGCEQGSDSDGVSQQSAQVEVQAQQSAAVPALEEKKRELASELQAATAKLEASSTEAGDVLSVLRSEKSAIMV